MLKWFSRKTTLFKKKKHVCQQFEGSSLYISRRLLLHYIFHKTIESWMFTSIVPSNVHWLFLCWSHLSLNYPSWLRTSLSFWVAYIISFFSVLFVSWIKPVKFLSHDSTITVQIPSRSMIQLQQLPIQHQSHFPDLVATISILRLHHSSSFLGKWRYVVS